MNDAEASIIKINHREGNATNTKPRRGGSQTINLDC